MKKIATILTALVVLQSCHSYKTMAINELEVDKRYEMQLKNELRVRGICHKISADSLEFSVKNRLLKYSKSDVAHVKRKKVSALKSVGLLAVFTTAAVLSVTTNNVESAFSQTRPR
ncbi:MAG: hypothetical protein ABJN95_13770 [Maribacter sp.]|uniref:hypothetical protein n=1 Tax=Maribacter sp. TaxID=1897614 RepID=UPI0032990B93